MSKKQVYRWFYAKNGDIKIITQPSTITGKKSSKQSKIKTGGLLGGVGFSMSKIK